MKITLHYFLILTFFIFYSTVVANIRLPKLISDGMILQRDAKVIVWGWADAAEKVVVDIDNKTYSTIANADGLWKISLKPHKAGGPFTMVLKGNNQLQINNILFGDVWLCSGQSNMELPMRRVKLLYEDEIAKASNPDIRIFTVPQKYNFTAPEDDFSSGEWQQVNPKNILDFSAVAYFFANELYQKYKVPVGLINASLGGSPIQAWMSEEALNAFPNYLNEAIKYRDNQLIKDIENADRKVSNDWYTLATSIDKGQSENWKNPMLNDTNWLEFKLPGYWSQTDIGNVNGVVWFRKEFNITKENAGKSAFLNLGRIVDADSVFINGKFVGNVTYQYPPRWYDVPENVLVEGRNVMVIRVVNNSGQGGFVPDKPYELKVGDETIDLKGVWKMKLGCTMAALPGQTFIRWKPMGLFNAMIAPLNHYQKKGVIWYQGESNTENPQEYGQLLPAMIVDWRKNFNQKKLPFIYAQLPNFMESKPEPSESNWALFREAQTKALIVHKTGMSVNIDAGEWNDIHPLNKKIIGVRLAKLAQQIAYNENKIIALAPTFQSMKIVGNKIELTFTKTKNQLTTIDRMHPKCFAIAGLDKKFVWANAQIKGNKIIVSSETIQQPVAVRYAWADNPSGANLTDSKGNFVSPFRTDNW